MSLNFLYFWLYTIFLVFIAAFFIIIRIHALKFRNFQTQIVTSLRILCFLLIVFAIIWYISLYFILDWGKTYTIEKVENAKTATDIESTINELQEEIY